MTINPNGLTAQDIAKRFNFKLTSLREQVLSILIDQKRPIKAYALLDLLQAKRPKAKAPTVYRVLNFLVENHVVIRLEAGNSYILSQFCMAGIPTKRSRITMVVRNRLDGTCVQFSDPSFDQLIRSWENQHQLRLEPGVIELHGEFLAEENFANAAYWSHNQQEA